MHAGSDFALLQVVGLLQPDNDVNTIGRIGDHYLDARTDAHLFAGHGVRRGYLVHGVVCRIGAGSLRAARYMTTFSVTRWT